VVGLEWYPCCRLKPVRHSKDGCLHFFYRKFNFSSDEIMITVKFPYNYCYCLRVSVQYAL